MRRLRKYKPFVRASAIDMMAYRFNILTWAIVTVADVCLSWSLQRDTELVWLAYASVAAWSESSCVCGWFGGAVSKV